METTQYYAVNAKICFSKCLCVKLTISKCIKISNESVRFRVYVPTTEQLSRCIFCMYLSIV